MIATHMILIIRKSLQIKRKTTMTMIWVMKMIISCCCINDVIDGDSGGDRYKSISHLIYPLTARVVGAPQMISQLASSIFLCSPLPSGTWRTSGLLSSHLFLCLSWLFKFSYCQTSHSLRMTVAAMLYFVAVFVNCPLFAPVEGATTQMSLFPNTGLTAVSVT